MTDVLDVLDDVAASWRPDPVEITRRIDAVALQNFADLLDRPRPFRTGDHCPLLWHWFAFAPSFPQSLLAEDGHPLASPMLPDFPDRRRMMAGGKIVQQRPFVVGNEYLRTTRLLDATVKQGRSGRMLITTVEHTFADALGTTTAVESETVVYRQQAEGSDRPLPRPEVVQDPWHAGVPAGGQVELATDPRLLFRFSALTYNTHRIHYDQRYATQVEKYPDLVVHGPLLALVMLELDRHAFSRRPSAFEYRLRTPAYCGDLIRAVQRDDDLAVGADGRAQPSADGRVLAYYG